MNSSIRRKEDLNYKWNPGERQAESIKAIRSLLAAAVKEYEQLGDMLYQVAEHLQVVAATDNSKDLAVLISRLEDIQCARRSMELGSFMVRMGPVLEESWRKLP